MTKIILADHENVDSVKEYADQLFEEMELESPLFISDKTMLQDFAPEPETLEKLTSLVGFSIGQKDYIVDICTRWRNRVDTSIA